MAAAKLSRTQITVVLANVLISFFQLGYAETKVTVTPAEIKIFNAASPSIYPIYAVAEEDTERAQVSGSAVAINEHLLATNCHVAFASDILIAGVDNYSRGAELIYYDGKKDICILFVADAKLKPVKMKPTQTLRAGDKIYAIETPHERIRLLLPEVITNKYEKNGVGMLMINTTVTPDSSGSGLFDANNNLVGIITSSDPNNENMNAVLPTELISEIVNSQTKVGLAVHVQQKPAAEQAVVSNDQESKPITQKAAPNQPISSVKDNKNNDIGMLRWRNKCLSDTQPFNSAKNISTSASGKSNTPAVFPKAGTNINSAQSDLCWHSNDR